MAFFLGWFTEKERREKTVAVQRAWGANHAVARSLLSVPEGAVQAWRCGGTFTIKTVEVEWRIIEIPPKPMTKIAAGRLYKTTGCLSFLK